jgi:hypothetical protein
MSIMVTRRGQGGQRRDVATAVLDIMRERYEMAERVFYHHKKASASAMLARLLELAGDMKPRGGPGIYPAPWTEVRPAAKTAPAVPHLVHLCDHELVQYLGSAPVAEDDRALQQNLYLGLRYRRKGLYRTLLVVDASLAEASRHSISYFAEQLRGPSGNETNVGRRALEQELAQAAGVKDGDIIIYCPSPKMQSKEVDARLEIVEERVLPLRVQTESFAYTSDVRVLQQYYQQLWLIYVFVAPSLFDDAVKCRLIVDAFCGKYGIPNALAYRKVRTHDFELQPGVTITRAFGAIGQFEAQLPFKDVPLAIRNGLLKEAAQDGTFTAQVLANASTDARLSALLEVAVLRGHTASAQAPLAEAEATSLDRRIKHLLAGGAPLRIAARLPIWDFAEYEKNVLNHAMKTKETAAAAES